MTVLQLRGVSCRLSVIFDVSHVWEISCEFRFPLTVGRDYPPGGSPEDFSASLRDMLAKEFTAWHNRNCSGNLESQHNKNWRSGSAA